MKKLKFILIISFVSCLSFGALAQVKDTAAVAKRERGPLTASLLSTVLPGAGQVYNGKYWKLPVVYGTLGSLVYFIGFYDDLYIEYRDKYANYDQKGPFQFYTINESSLQVVERRKDLYRRKRDLLIILTGLAYVLNIADASVDAHLKDYDISRYLGVNISPTVQQYENTYALSLKCSIRF